MDLLKKLTPVFEEDNDEWQELVSELNGNLPPLFWYGGAAFDRKPIVALFDGSFPKEVQDVLSPNIFPVLTDYNSNIVKTLKYIYEIFDIENFRLDSSLVDYWFSSKLSGIEILQMIPLTLFDSNELKRIRQKYQNFHSAVTSSVVPDDKWHFVYILLEVNGQEASIIYGLIENLTFWKEIVEKYDLNIEAFCALRVGGKSGSWDQTHSPNSGSLFNAIRKSSSTKPKIWIADECSELRKIWREINPHEKGFYGVMHFFEAKWNNLQ